MSINASYLRRAAQMGLTLEQAAELAEIIEAGFAQLVPTYAPSGAALRQKRYRNKKNGVTESVTRDVTQDVTGDVTGDVTPPVTVTPPHVRGENNLSRLVDNNLTTPNFASEPDLDWPGDASPSRAYLDKLEAAVREAGGSALDPTATKLFSLAPILALGRAGKGPACDLQADVLPTIRARSLKAAPQSIGGWDYFTKACLEARDRRLAGAGAVQALRPSGHDPPRRQSLSEQVGAEAAAAKALTLKRLEAANG